MDFELNENEEQVTEWVNWWDGVSDDTDFKMVVDRIYFDEDKNAFYLFNNEDEEKTVATSVYTVNHPKSKYQDNTPHGVRFARAAIRHLKCDTNSDAIVEAINASPVVVTVKRAEMKNGNKSLLWIVGAVKTDE
jgi:hypothetical protein